MSHQRQLVQLATETLMTRRQGCLQLHARRRCRQQTESLLLTHHNGSYYVSRRSISSSSSPLCLSWAQQQRSISPSTSSTYCHWWTNDFKRGRCRNNDEIEIQYRHQWNHHHHQYQSRLLNQQQHHHHHQEQRRYYQSREKSSDESSTTNTTTSSITEHDIEELYKCMNDRPGSLLTTGGSGGGVGGGHDDLSKYNTDWTKKFHGQSIVVVRPINTDEVSRIVGYCNTQKIGIVPQGGNTSLVGGSISYNPHHIVLTLECMNTIYHDEFDDICGIVKCDAGVILQDLQDYVSTQHDHILPIDLGSKGSCQIGGNVSTNAGGSYYYRYGSIHANIVGLQVVIPSKNGGSEVLDLSYTNTNLKDTTGYDLKHIFVGSEGTLGIITKIALLCPSKQPKSKQAALVVCRTFDHVIQTLSLAKLHLGEILAAFEYMDDTVMNIVIEQKIKAKNNAFNIPSFLQEYDDGGNGESADNTTTSTTYPYSILIETHGSNEDHDKLKMEQFIEKVMMPSSSMSEEPGGDGGEQADTEGQPIVMDGVIAQDLSQVKEFWKFREACNPSVASTGYVYKYDVSLPIPEFPIFIQEMRQRIQSKLASSASSSLAAITIEIQNPNWGHVIDGNLHFNVVTPGVFEKNDELLKIIEPYIFEAVLKRKGSISAEHGLGICKNEYLPMVRDENVLSTMFHIKNLFDPNGIMNPGKYLPTRRE